MEHFLLVKKKYTVCKVICETPLLFQLKFDYSKKLKYIALLYAVSRLTILFTTTKRQILI